MPSIKRTPPYLQVARHLRGQITRGELRGGDVVPSVRQIAECWHVSQATAMRAIAALRADGLVETEVGVGTIVRAAPTGRVTVDRRELDLLVAVARRYLGAATDEDQADVRAVVEKYGEAADR